MAEQVRLGMVGSGMMGQLAHLAYYVTLADVEVVAIAEGRAKLAQRVAARYEVPEVVPDHRALLERDDLDGVVAILPIYLNYGVGMDVLAAGKHLATEKSISVGLPAARALSNAASEAGVVYQVSYMKRHDPGVVAARQQIDSWRASGEAGDLRLARIWCCSPGDWTWHIEAPLRTDEPMPAYQAAPEPATGADEAMQKWVWTWLNYYSHQTNLMRYLLGEDYHVAYHDSWSGGDIVHAVTDRGARVILEFHKFHDPGWEEGFEVTFAEGRVKGSLPAPLSRQQPAAITIEHNGDDGRIVQPYLPPIGAMRAQAEGFVNAIRGGQQLSPASEAVKEVELAWGLAEELFG